MSGALQAHDAPFGPSSELDQLTVPSPELGLEHLAHGVPHHIFLGVSGVLDSYSGGPSSVQVRSLTKRSGFATLSGAISLKSNSVSSV